jgi:ribosomal protein L40E
MCYTIGYDRTVYRRACVRTPRRRLWCLGATLIHLICLRCNRANAPEAKFCSECGAGLLRKFCSRCHAINDAESHFCQSCGEALPAQPSVPPAPPKAPPAVVPDLTDVYAGFDDPPPQVTAAAPNVVWVEEPAKAALPVIVTGRAWDAPAAVLSSHRTVLFGFVGGAAVLLAALLWSRGDHSGTPPVDAPMPAAPSVATSVGATALAAVPAPVQSTPEAAQDATPRPGPAGGASAAVRPPAASVQVSKAPERRLTPEAQIAAQPPAAGPAPRDVPAERKGPVRSTPPPSLVLECTPQVDALGLCAPGARIADKSGSR